MKEFLVYRFPNLNKINGLEIKEFDKNKAKNIFQNFDKMLQLPEKFFNLENIRQFRSENRQEGSGDKQYLKIFNKIVNETAEEFVSGALVEAERDFEVEKRFEEEFEKYAEEVFNREW